MTEKHFRQHRKGSANPQKAPRNPQKANRFRYEPCQYHPTETVFDVLLSTGSTPFPVRERVFSSSLYCSQAVSYLQGQSRLF
jgi:hypothetical protein